MRRDESHWSVSYAIARGSPLCILTNRMILGETEPYDVCRGNHLRSEVTFNQFCLPFCFELWPMN